ncbi:hypothetical protein CDV31_017028 [Fusarium ambrosium]|uniref:BZIP domain-containing protein n=1 Tax=Fusarium ambrosium TaxID=131363 RepID=A0A428RV66_9HYPO|nr:hypothetical protein CDV31_017028 [Fusarium ambrosium]
MASPEAYICPPPTTTAWPQKTQWIQDSPTHLQSMQPYLGSPPSKDAAPLWQEDVHVGGTRNGWFGVEERQYYLALPGSEQVIPVPVDLTQASKNMNAKRKRNAAASVRHRKKKKVVEEENLKELRELRKEMKEWEMYTKEMEADRNYYRGIIKQIPELQHFVRPRNILSRTTNFAVTVDGLATKPQGSLDERQPERRRIDRVSGFYTPENRAFIESFSSSQTFELPLKQNPQNTSTNWLLP